MSEIQKAAQYRSFYEVAKKIKNAKARLAFYDALDAYRFEGIEPKNLPFEADLAFTAIKPNIDADLDRKIDGQKGGRPPKTEKGGLLENKKGGFLNSKTNDKDNVNDKDTVNVDEKENVKAEPETSAPLPLPDGDFSKNVFEIFQKSGLPCCNGNYPTFIQRDFKLALPYLRGLRAEEVIAAAQNYAMIFQRPDLDAFWAKQKSPFDKFAEKKIRDFLPENFSLEKYLSAKSKTWGAL